MAKKGARYIDASTAGRNRARAGGATRPVALVTGASAGIGRELAKCFAAGGHDLVVVARRRPALDDLAAELGRAHGAAVRVVPADLANPLSPQRLFDQVASETPHLAALVNNAGFGARGPFATLDVSRQMAMVQVNAAALTHLTRLFLPAMIERRSGRILNVASVAGFLPGPMMAVYYATKAYVISLSEALSEELGGTGVTATCLCPGPTETEFAAVADLGDAPLFRFGAMTAAAVAHAGHAGAMAGERLVIPGLRNRLGAAAGRMAPRGLTLRMARQWLAR